MAFQAFQERLRQLFRRAKFDGGVVSKSTPVVEVVQTWKNTNETFTGLKINITDTASAAASLLADLQVGGASKASIRKDGRAYFSQRVQCSGIAFEGIFDSGVYLFGQYGAALCYGTRPIIGSDNYEGIINNRLTFVPQDSTGTRDISLARNATGVLEVNSGTAGTFRDLKLRNLIGSGNLATGSVAKTADYTATTSDGTIEVDASGAACTITLFAASGNAGKIIVVKKTDSSANTVIIDANASETIDGATTISLASQYSTAILQVNAAGTGWNKLAGV